jgi:hypothetical protein
MHKQVRGKHPYRATKPQPTPLTGSSASNELLLKCNIQKQKEVLLPWETT